MKIFSSKEMEYPNDFRYILDILANRRPERLPVYEHITSPLIMEKILSVRFADLIDGGPSDRDEFFRQYCRFFKQMTYDTVSFEVTITDLLPDHGAILGGRPGPIQDRRDIENYPWAELPEIFWKAATPLFDALLIESNVMATGSVCLAASMWIWSVNNRRTKSAARFIEKGQRFRAVTRGYAHSSTIQFPNMYQWKDIWQ